MDNPDAPFEAISDAREHVCQHCAASFIAARSDQRFCSDYCRLRDWRSRKTLQPSSPSSDPGRIDTLLAEINRLQRQVAELQRTNASLREGLKRTQLELQASQSGYRRWL